jgi:hypothetical protein
MKQTHPAKLTASGPTSTENYDETFVRLYCAALTGLCAQNKESTRKRRRAMICVAIVCGGG